MKPLRALVADDSVDDVRLMMRVLENGGYAVDWRRVQSEPELRAALSEKWQIVLADYSMPGFTGLDVLRILQQIAPELPCVIISGTIGEDTAVSVMQAGARDFFLKDRLVRLPAAIDRHLREAEILREKNRAETELHEMEKQLSREREEALTLEKNARRRIEILYEQAQESSRLKEQFLVMISHELRTPMTAISGWSELLVNGQCDPADYGMAFSSIFRNARLQNRIIDDLLSFSAMASNSILLESGDFEVSLLIESAVSDVEKSAEEKHLEIRSYVGPGVGRVRGDFQRLQEILIQLLRNSVKFTPPGGHVTVSAERKNDDVEFHVADDGEGIDADFLPHVFERFRQADAGTTRKHGGLGLGLAIVQHLVGMMHGHVSAKSDGLGRGATLTVRVPLPPRGEVTLAAAAD